MVLDLRATHCILPVFGFILTFQITRTGAEFERYYRCLHFTLFWLREWGPIWPPLTFCFVYITPKVLILDSSNFVTFI